MENGKHFAEKSILSDFFLNKLIESEFSKLLKRRTDGKPFHRYLTESERDVQCGNTVPPRSGIPILVSLCPVGISPFSCHIPKTYKPAGLQAPDHPQVWVCVSSAMAWQHCKGFPPQCMLG